MAWPWLSDGRNEEPLVPPIGPTARLMNDIAEAFSSGRPVYMLGGGNPGRVAAVGECFTREFLRFLEGGDFAALIGNYSSPQGEGKIREALCSIMNRHYGWSIEPANVALTNGSQSLYYGLLKFLSGDGGPGEVRPILFPKAPEYIGYLELISERASRAARPNIELIGDQLFKYHLDFAAIEAVADRCEAGISAICVSSPNNPSGDVVPLADMRKLDDFARSRGVPLIIDNAYGAPFPSLIYNGGPTEPYYSDNSILTMSLSKVGAAGLRTGFVVAGADTIRQVAEYNAIQCLAPGSMAMPLADLISSGGLSQLAIEEIRPFYQRKRDLCSDLLQREFTGYPVRWHKPEGAFFMWIWFQHLPIAATELYQQLKKRDVIIVPGGHFQPASPGSEQQHCNQCIRLSYSTSNESELSAGIAILAEEVRRLYDRAELGQAPSYLAVSSGGKPAFRRSPAEK